MDEKKVNGFSMIELLIGMITIAMIVIIVISIYTSYVHKARRIDAIDTLLAISLAEERYRSSTNQYGTLDQVWQGVTTTPAGFYDLSITDLTADGYTLTAIGKLSQLDDAVNKTSCRILSLSMHNGTLVKEPSICWPHESY